MSKIKLVHTMSLDKYKDQEQLSVLNFDKINQDNTINIPDKFKPSNPEPDQVGSDQLQDDTKLLAIIHKLETGGKLYKPVKFQTPEALKQLGNIMFLVNTQHEAERLIKNDKVFACTYQDLKNLAKYAKENNRAGIMAIMAMNIFSGKEIYSNN